MSDTLDRNRDCLSVPAEDAFGPGVEVGYQEDEDEDDHLGQEEGGEGVVLEDGVGEEGGEGVEENDFDVEDQKDHGDEIKAHVESASGVADGDHAGFVGDGFAGVLGFWAENNRGEDHAGGGDDADDQEKNDGEPGDAGVELGESRDHVGMGVAGDSRWG